MFTGIIEEIGSLESINKSGDNYRLKIKAKKVLENTEIGDSISTNGVCLTVVEMTENSYSADVMAETLRKSSLGDLRLNSPVNLERALTLNKPLGGHLVSGHIDGVGSISSIVKEKNAIWFEVAADKEILKYIINKGSVALDGISLTIGELLNSSFKVSIIPHTLGETNLHSKKIGDPINIEVDLVGKYIERFLNFETEAKDESKISMNFLAENGFL